ncbi:helix-turn-helix domain-containing protein [Paenibacillus sp. FSL W7-1279]|jgi:sugar-specific transcriptional regulator TrmB|uniref:TrmB family transcriptional regulator n=1 Tax=unclassified Paenibacillus TaxID=185978 RepID=UPI0030D0F3DD
MKDELKKIGLSDLEARCYIVLHKESNLTGYEVAKRASVSRANVYAALKSLSDKGGCRVIDGDPVRYDVVPIEKFINQLKSSFNKSEKILKEQLKETKRTTYGFYNLQDIDQIKMVLQRMIASAKDTIIADFFPEDLSIVKYELSKAEAKGISVILVTFDNDEAGLKNVFLDKRINKWPHSAVRNFSIIVDGNSALIGGIQGDLKASAMETEHPAIIELLESAFYHDVIMSQIEKDFGDQLTNKYGKDFEMILNNLKSITDRE